MEFQKKKSNSIIGKLGGPLVKISFILIVLIGLIYALGSIDFPALIKRLKKIIPNENFKIIK